MLMMSFLLFLLAKNNIRIISKSTAVPEYRIIEVTIFWIIKHLIQICFWMYFNIKLCRCQLQLHQNIDKKVVYQILKSPAIEMIAGLNFNIQMIYLSKKGREKGRVWIEIQCNSSHLAKRKNAWNQRFSSVLIRIECLLHLYLQFLNL